MPFYARDLISNPRGFLKAISHGYPGKTLFIFHFSLSK
jgi:hypothetical protein